MNKLTIVRELTDEQLRLLRLLDNNTIEEFRGHDDTPDGWTQLWEMDLCTISKGHDPNYPTRLIRASQLGQSLIDENDAGL